MSDENVNKSGILQSEQIKNSEIITTPEGFKVHGRNETSFIRSLSSLNGILISILEERMRPGDFSKEGFLGKNESLIDILVADNDTVVTEMGLTHQQLADFLLFKGVGEEDRKAIRKGEKLYEYNGRKFKVEMAVTFGAGGQPSPFDDGTNESNMYILTNVDTGETISYAGLLPEMIHRYGFYEGKDTPYRLDPRAIAQVAGLLQEIQQLPAAA